MKCIAGLKLGADGECFTEGISYHYTNAVSRVPVNLCTNLCYHMLAGGGVRAT